MLYLPGQTSHNLPHDPFKACVVPRPIGWISTTSSPIAPSEAPRHNLAPYSQFNNLTFDPPYVMFAANQTSSASRKDTVRNVEATGKFVWNLATWDLREEVNITAQQFQYGIDEFARAGLEKEFSSHLAGDAENPVPMVKRSPVKFECVYHSTLRLPGNPPLGAADVVIGRVVAVHIADWALTEGRLDVTKTKPIARCGYYEYAVVDKTFEMVIPGLDEITLAGMEGNRERVNKLKAKI
jgi:flavin reductase (DIM6/NTAB) family NADH-FMN oxidoreductase RutF